MRVYVAGASAELTTVRGYVARVRELGHEVTHDWTEEVLAVGQANPTAATHQDRLRWSKDDLRGILDADLFWLLVPREPSVGCWVEFGYAIRAQVGRVQVIASGSFERTIFTSLADVRFNSHDAALRWLATVRS